MNQVGSRTFIGGAVGIATAGSFPRHRVAAVVPLVLRPPMGWNGGRRGGDLRPFGGDVFTVHIQDCDPDTASHDYNRHPVPSMDGIGWPVRAVDHFPSSNGSRGFAPLATGPYDARNAEMEVGYAAIGYATDATGWPIMLSLWADVRSCRTGARPPARADVADRRRLPGRMDDAEGALRPAGELEPV